MSTISQVSAQLGLSTHTLRYYEKIHLLAPVNKTTSGRREYSKADIARIKFIKRAQRMHFSLEEIRDLIEIDQANIKNRAHAQTLVTEKLDAIEESLKDLLQLKQDLSAMLSECRSRTSDETCPIIDELKHN